MVVPSGNRKLMDNFIILLARLEMRYRQPDTTPSRSSAVASSVSKLMMFAGSRLSAFKCRLNKSSSIFHPRKIEPVTPMILLVEFP